MTGSSLMAGLRDHPNEIDRTGRFAPMKRAGVASAMVLSLLSACKDPVGSRYEPDDAVKERGLLAINEAGCAACHEIPGVAWPKGRLGPSLEGFDDVGMIAGQLPNRPDLLAAFIRNAPSVKRGTTMPAMPITQRESVDIAAYLYGLDDD